MGKHGGGKERGVGNLSKKFCSHSRCSLMKALSHAAERCGNVSGSMYCFADCSSPAIPLCAPVNECVT